MFCVPIACAVGYVSAAAETEIAEGEQDRLGDGDHARREEPRGEDPDAERGGEGAVIQRGTAVFHIAFSVLRGGGTAMRFIG